MQLGCFKHTLFMFYWFSEMYTYSCMSNMNFLPTNVLVCYYCDFKLYLSIFLPNNPSIQCIEGVYSFCLFQKDVSLFVCLSVNFSFCQRFLRNYST